MLSRGVVLILLAQVCLAENLRADLKDIRPDFERFMTYFEGMQPQQPKVEDAAKMTMTIKSIIGVGGISPVQKQKLLFKLAQIHLQREQVRRRDLISAANALRQVLKVRGSQALARKATLQLALTLSRLGNDNALFYYRKLLQQEHNDRANPYVHLARAEHLFAAGKYSQAEKYYQRVLPYHKHRAYPFAVYKLGWNYFYMRNKERRYLPRAIKTFKKVVTMTRKSQHSQLVALHKDAVSDLAHVWSELQEINASQKFFVALNKHAAWHFTLQRTAQLYVKQKQTAKAIAVYKLLLKNTALLPTGPDNLLSLLELLFKSGKHQQLVSYIQKVPDYFAEKNSTWYLRHKDLPQTAQRLTTLSETMWKYTRHLYELGTDPRYQDARKHARTIIQVYLQTFPESENYLQARFLLADILYEFSYLERASQHYLAISQRGERDVPLTKIAALNAIKAMRKLLSAADDFTKAESADLRLKYKATIDNYLHLFPEEVEARPLLLTAARMELQLKHTARAKQRLQTLLETFPAGKEAEQAVHIMLKLMITAKDWRNLITWVDSNRKLHPSLTNKANKMLADAYRHANYQLALQLQNTEQYRAAAVQFLHYQKLFQEDQLADKALYLAGENYYRIAANDAAIDSHNLLVDNYPHSEFSQEALLKLARTHEQAGLFALAAGYYHTFGTKFVKSKYNYRALTKAMRYYFYQDMFEEALHTADYIRKKFTANLPQDFYETLAAIHIKAERYEEAWQVYSHLLASPSLTAVNFNLDFFDVLYDNGHEDRLRYAIEKLQIHAKDGTFKDIIAALRFKLLLKPLHEFLVVAIDEPLHVDSVVQRKQQKLLYLVSEFEQIIKIGDPEWQTAALYQLGEMHENFAAMIFNAPKLVGASQQEVDTYRSRMEKAAFPLKSEAHKYYQAAWHKAQQGSIFTPWMLKAYDKVTSIYPDKHPQLTEKVNTPLYLTHKLHLHDSTKILLR